MALMEQDSVRSFVAGADLRTKQGLFVKHHTTAGQVVVAGDGELAIGVLMNKPNTGEAAEVVMLDPGSKAKVIASAALAIGARISSDANGKAAASAAGEYVAGVLDTASLADGDWVEFTPLSAVKREA